MSKSPLLSLLKVRRMSLDQAKAALVAALAAEHDASIAEADAAREIQQAIVAASEPSADDHAVEALAAWLPKARHMQGVAMERHRVAAASTARARADLGAARAAEAVVERILSARQAEARALSERHAQAALNEQISGRSERNKPAAP